MIYGDRKRQPAPKRPARFTILPTIDGFEVIDNDGRPVDHRETAASANGVAHYLNTADRDGPATLATLLSYAPPSDRLGRAARPQGQDRW